MEQEDNKRITKIKKKSIKKNTGWKFILLTIHLTCEYQKQMEIQSGR